MCILCQVGFPFSDNPHVADVTPEDRAKLLAHKASEGIVGGHYLGGGSCPVCGAVYMYPGWTKGSQDTERSNEYTVIL